MQDLIGDTKAHQAPGSPESEPSRGARRIDDGDRIYYLFTKDSPNRTTAEITFGRGTRASVITWEGNRDLRCGEVTLTLHGGDFGFHACLTPEDARHLAAALLMAADDVDAMRVAGAHRTQEV